MKRKEWVLIALVILVVIGLSKPLATVCKGSGESCSCPSKFDSSCVNLECCSESCKCTFTVAGSCVSWQCVGEGTTTTTPFTTTILTTTVLTTTTPPELTTTMPPGKMLDVVVVNDLSGSMSTNDKIGEMKTATRRLTDIILFDPNNYLGLVGYSNYAHRSLALTQDKQILYDEIDSYVTWDTTCISCGVVEGTAILDAGTNPTKVMLIMTDGLGNSCIPGVGCSSPQAKEEAIIEAIRISRDEGVNLYCIAFGEDADAPTMQEMCTYGTFYYASEVDLEQLYRDIGYELVPEARVLELKEIYAFFDQLWWSVWNIIQEIFSWLGG